MDEAGTDDPTRYRVEPRRVLWAWGGSVLGAVLVATALVVFTPVRELIPGYGTEAMRREAQLNAMRVNAMQDSLEVQRQYMQHLQNLITGRVDSAAASAPAPAPEDEPPPPDREPAAALPDAQQPSENWSDHQQPALSATQLATAASSTGAVRQASASQPPPMPLMAPVETGFPTRGFDARSGHYGIDIAVEKGSTVRAIADGYVVFADWTQEGGYALLVQHEGGLLSTYKHNRRLLKQMGDRVRGGEAVAVSGNSGEISTGPHLHFELWNDGLAQDPRQYIASW
jgi:murein DD-endopeptidase MepM/ murein hydrolase activator NlpD